MTANCPSSWLPLLVVAVALTASQSGAQDKDKKAKKAPLTLSLALKLGAENLTSYTDGSEAGQDQAAHLYAIARQIETERTLAQKDLKQVAALREWRDAISKCRRDATGLAYIVNGGGTMYSHGGARDGAAVEDFLAELAKRLPLAEGKGSAKAVKKIDATIEFFKTLTAPADGDADSNKEAKASLAARVQQSIEHWESLKYMSGEVSAEEAGRIVTFASDSLAWLKE